MKIKTFFLFINFRVTVNMLSIGRDGLRVKNMRNIRDTYLPKYVSRVKFERFHTILAAIRNKKTNVLDCEKACVGND